MMDDNSWVILWKRKNSDHPRVTADIASADEATMVVRAMLDLPEVTHVLAVCPASRLRDLECRKPPVGWWCSREPGHDGPCAARPL